MKKISLLLIMFLLYKNICYSNFMTATKAILIIKFDLFFSIKKRILAMSFVKIDNIIGFYFLKNRRYDMHLKSHINNLNKEIKHNNEFMKKIAESEINKIKKFDNEKNNFNKKQILNLYNYAINIKNYGCKIDKIQEKEQLNTKKLLEEYEKYEKRFAIKTVKLLHKSHNYEADNFL